MTKRPSKAQSGHDEAVLLIAQQDFDIEGLDVYINAGQREVYGLNGSWPDIVVVKDRIIHNDEVMWIAEVETAESVTAAEAAKWKIYAKLRIRFVLYVPLLQCKAARKLCAKHGIGLFDVKGYRIEGGTLVTRSCPD